MIKGFRYESLIVVVLLLDLVYTFSTDEQLLPSRRRNQQGSGLRTTLNDDVIPCGAFKHVQINETVVIQSPNFNTTGTRGISYSCKWRFLFPGCSLAISCPSFRLNNFFCLDYFEIKDVNGKTERYCGRKGPNLKINTANKQVEFTFKTNPLFNTAGFRCRLLCQDDNGDILNGGGVGGAGISQIPSKPTSTSNCTCGEGAHGVKIINGEMTSIGEFPWIAGLVRAGSSYPFCGGSLINSRYILTAAHCVSGRTPNNLKIILNEPSAQVGTEKPSPLKIRNVDMIVSHRSYSARLDYDVALVKLSEPVDLTGDIVPVCLPTDTTENYLKKPATVSGWGATSEGGSLSQYLLKVDVDVITNEQCSLVYPFVVTNRMLCAYREHKDACQGDSGGPLMLANGQGRNSRSLEPDLTENVMAYAKYTQIGIVSWGQGCARPDKPGVYTRITHFVPWIQRVVFDGSFCDA